MMTRGPGLQPAEVLRRIALILIAVVAMFQILFWLRPEAGEHGEFRRVSTIQEPDARAPIDAEIGPFRDLVAGEPFVAIALPSPHVVVQTRAERRARRAFEGAPPVIPHGLDPEVERTQDCAPCHAYGGYNPGLRTYAPRSPHPEQTNCLQCHLLPVTGGTFVESDWTYVSWPAYGSGGALLDAPPTIPHALQQREHCLACHGGTAAAPDIRTIHPERFNCRQCHVPAETDGVFVRPASPGGGP